jgi:Fungal protein kinase
MSTTPSARQVAGQIVSYTTTLLSAQYRTHTFSVLVVGNYARLIRWDRSGAVVTEPIYYNAHPSLFNFFVRYDNASKEMRGHDPTVGLPTNDEEWKARMLDDLVDAKSLLAITIQDPSSLKSSRYIVRGPRAQPNIPAGRWTRTSIAYDVQTHGRVLLKDSWRVLLDDIQPEGAVYRTLEARLVPNIPRCLLSGDVGEDNYHRSQTDRFASKYWVHTCTQKVVPHRHYRLVLGTIGKKLHEFDNSRQVIKAVYDSLLGKLTKCWQSRNVS